jgi:hypothetical protein
LFSLSLSLSLHQKLMCMHMVLNVASVFGIQCNNSTVTSAK